MKILNKKELKSVIGGATIIETGLLLQFQAIIGALTGEIVNLELGEITKLENENNKIEITFANGSEIKIDENGFKFEIYDPEGNEFKIEGQLI